MREVLLKQGLSSNPRKSTALSVVDLGQGCLTLLGFQLVRLAKEEEEIGV
jgi:hypothetical protein